MLKIVFFTDIQTPKNQNSQKFSPEYSDVRDAIPFSKGSPKYAEITDGVCREISNISPDYMTLSTFQKPDLKGLPKTRLNRRRSKSLEDIYAVPLKLPPNDNRPRMIREESFSSMGGGPPPPIPERQFSPKEISMPELSFDRNIKNPLFENIFQRRNSYRRDSFNKAILNKNTLVAQNTSTDTDQLFHSLNTSVSSGIYSMDYFDGSLDTSDKRSPPKKRRSQESSVTNEEISSSSEGKKPKPNYPPVFKKSPLVSSSLSFPRTNSVMSNASSLSSNFDSIQSDEINSDDKRSQTSSNSDSSSATSVSSTIRVTRSKKSPLVDNSSKTFNRTDSMSSNISSVSTTRLNSSRRMPVNESSAKHVRTNSILPNYPSNSTINSVDSRKSPQKSLASSRTNSMASNISTVSSTFKPKKLSILTGSYQATTRSPYRRSTLEEEEPQTEKTENNHDLSIISIKQLEESPKSQRRRLKRRSSSLSTTPGKGLTFGKMTKISSSSRRVSFARDVKETDGTDTPHRNIPKQNSLARSAPPVTRQSLERKEFESFISAHQSPPTKSPPKKPTSPSKMRSFVRTSPHVGPNSKPTPVIGRRALRAQKMSSTSLTSQVSSIPSDKKFVSSANVTSCQDNLNFKSTSTTLSYEKSEENSSEYNSIEGPRDRTIDETSSKAEESQDETTSNTDTVSDSTSQEETVIERHVHLPHCNEESNQNSPEVYQTMKYKDIECNQETRVNLLLAEFHARTASANFDEVVESPELLSGENPRSSQSDTPTRRYSSRLSETLKNACINSVSSTASLLEKDLSNSVRNIVSSVSSVQTSDIDDDVFEDISKKVSNLKDQSHRLSQLQVSMDDPEELSCSPNHKTSRPRKSDLITPKYKKEEDEVESNDIHNDSKLHLSSEKHASTFLKDMTLPLSQPESDSGQETCPLDGFSLNLDSGNFDDILARYDINPKLTSSQHNEMNLDNVTKSDAQIEEHLAADITTRENRSEAELVGSANQEKAPPSINCDRFLKRIESIKASPKVVSNDGWITERRRSSKGRISRSFRSAYNKQLLDSSRLEDDAHLARELDESIANCSLDLNMSSSKDLTKSESKLISMEQKSEESSSSFSLQSDKEAESASQESVTRRKAPQVKPKPAVLPKTKALGYKVNVNNFINSSPSRRKSSMRNSPAKRESSDMKENFIQRNITAVRRESLKAKDRNRSIGKNPSFSNRDQNEGPMKDPKVSKNFSTIGKKDCSINSPKRESTGNRRSSTKLMSFSDRRKFFQQMQEEKKSSTTRPNTSKFTRSVEPRVQSTNLRPARMFKVQNQEDNNFALSPKSEMKL